MTAKGKKLNKEVIDHWPEILSEIKLNVLPIQYLESVEITFKNGKSWIINVSSTGKKSDRIVSFENELFDILKTYDRYIVDIDFRLDIRKVKKDMESKTNSFLKKKVQ